MRLQTKQQFYDARRLALLEAGHGIMSYGTTAGRGYLCLDCLSRHGQQIVQCTFYDDYDDDPRFTVTDIRPHWEGQALTCCQCSTKIEPTYRGKVK